MWVQVVGCVKNTMLVWVGVLMGDVVTWEQMLGYSISVAGFALYTNVKRQQSLASQAAAKKAA